MIPKECKRLAEVDFPIAVVSKNAAREKSGPPGYPSRLHIWWAHRPLAACRAILLALLLPDPCDANCPREFKDKARALLLPLIPNMGPTDLLLRRGLLQFIGEFSDWGVAANSRYLEVSRGLVTAAYASDVPLVVDPFAGRGSIPLEALRIGCDAYGSDLNPVAALILRILLEYTPRRGHQLAEALEQAGATIQELAKKQLADLYPRESSGAHPIAYLWARTVRCEAPDCGAEIPVYKSPWLAKKGASGARYFREDRNGTCVALLIQDAPRGGPVSFRIAKGNSSEEAQPGYVRLSGTKAAGNNANVVCPCCGVVLSGNKNNPRTSTQLAAQRGGASVVFDDEGKRVGGARLLAVVTRTSGEQGQSYRLPTDDDYAAVWQATTLLKGIIATSGSLPPVPDEPTPAGGGSGAGRAFSVQRYGMMKWSDLFTARQNVGLIKLIELLSTFANEPDLAALLAVAFNRVAMSNMSCTRWNASAQKMQHTFGRQALPIVWDFAEIVPTAEAPGNWESGYKLVAEVVDKWPPGSLVGQAQIADACEPRLIPESASVWFTDPPYYDAVPYSDLADFFLVWLKRTLPDKALISDPFDPTNPLSPKTREIVQDETRSFEGHPKDKSFFEEMMGNAFSQGRRILKPDGIGCVVFAHKTTEGWEALLSGMISGGWTITASWPIATEMSTRLRARESAALATSVHLICRRREDDCGIGDWSVVFRELPKRVADWMERLQAEGIRGADLVFACIGPALEIYSRYSKVVDAEEREIPLGGNPEASDPYARGYLAYVWEVVGRTALEHVLGTAEAKARNGAAGALEEDSRLTALFLWTLQSTSADTSGRNDAVTTDQDDAEDDEETETAPRKKKGLSLSYDVVRRIAQPLGIHLPEWEGRIVETDKGVVRLLPVSERAEQLFGAEGAAAVAHEFERAVAGTGQLRLFPDEQVAPQVKARGRKKKSTSAAKASPEARREATTLDRVHAAMLLQSSGQANALRRLLQEEQDRGPDFVRLSNALSALYPKDSDEKRLLDAMLLAVPR